MQAENEVNVHFQGSAGIWSTEQQQDKNPDLWWELILKINFILLFFMLKAFLMNHNSGNFLKNMLSSS